MTATQKVGKCLSIYWGVTATCGGLYGFREEAKISMKIKEDVFENTMDGLVGAVPGIMLGPLLPITFLLRLTIKTEKKELK